MVMPTEVLVAAAAPVYRRWSSSDDLIWAVVRTKDVPGSGRTFVNNIAYGISHELVEAVTNQAGAPALLARISQPVDKKVHRSVDPGSLSKV